MSAAIKWTCSSECSVKEKLFYNCVFKYCTAFNFMHMFLKILLYITAFCMGDRHLDKHILRFVLRSVYLSHSSFSSRFFFSI